MRFFVLFLLVAAGLTLGACTTGPGNGNPSGAAPMTQGGGSAGGASGGTSY